MARPAIGACRYAPGRLVVARVGLVIVCPSLGLGDTAAAVEFGRRVLAALDLSYPNAGDPPAESARMYGVETLPTAFVVDGAGFVRHAGRGTATRNINAIEPKISFLIEPMRRPEEGQP